MISSTKPSSPMVALSAGSCGMASASLRLVSSQTCSRVRCMIRDYPSFGDALKGLWSEARVKLAHSGARRRQGDDTAPMSHGHFDTLFGVDQSGFDLAAAEWARAA